MINNQFNRRGAFKSVFAIALLIALTAAAISLIETVTSEVVSAQSQAVTAKTADSFIDTVGVNIHLHYNGTPYFYAFDEIVKPKLLESNIRHVRDGLITYRHVNRDTFFYQRVRELARGGIKFDFITAMPNHGNPGSNYDLLDDVYEWSDRSIVTFEGINEPNIQNNSDWINITRTEHRKLWDTVQNNPLLRNNVKVIAPSPIFYGSYELGDMTSILDFGNGHPYPGGFCPSCRNVYGQNVDTIMPEYQGTSGNKTMTVTETGYHNAVNIPGHMHRPVSELAGGKYMPRLFFEYFNRGYARTYTYEFIDEYNDTSRTDNEHNFGLLRHDGSEKPAFTALKNVLGVLKDPGPAFTPGSLRYTLGGDTNDVHQTLLQKRDGTFYLALWLEKPSYETGMRANEPQNPDLEPARRHDYAVPTQPITITLNVPVRNPTVFSLDDAGNLYEEPATVGGNVIYLNVPDKITIIKLAPDLSASGQPDLVVTDVTWTPTNPAPGAAVTFAATVKNQGTAATPGNTIHGVSFKVNNNGVSWAATSDAGLQPGESRVIVADGGPQNSRNWTAGAAGNYTVTALADDVNRISNESNESNNQFSKQITVGNVSGQPDLVVTDITWTPANPAPGAAITFSATIKNQGGVATPSNTVHGVGFKVNNALVAWSASSGAGLQPGESRTLTADGGPQNSRDWTAGAAGNYTVTALADDVNRIPNESDESNNQLSKQLVVNNPNVGGLIDGAVYEFEPECAIGQRLDVSGSATGAAVQLWTAYFSPNQRFQAFAVGDDSFELEPLHAATKRLDVVGARTNNGAALQMWNDNNGANQRWRVFAVGNGYYELEPAHAPGKRLDVAEGRSANGTAVQLYDDNNSAAQRWRLIKQ